MKRRARERRRIIHVADVYDVAVVAVIAIVDDGVDADGSRDDGYGTNSLGRVVGHGSRVEERFPPPVMGALPP